MSIPPLVCSTPPPPDQCEDDKDPEDFDLSYSLSQEDDDDENGYNYGNFSSYNHIQSGTDNKPLEMKEEPIASNVESEVSNEIFTKYDDEKDPKHDITNSFTTNCINESKTKCDEDINIEDLDLRVDEEIESIVESNNEHIEASETNIVSMKDFDIPCNSNNNSPSCDNTNVSSFDDNVTDITGTFIESNLDLNEQIVTQTNNILTDNESSVDITAIKDNVASFLYELDKTPQLCEHLETTHINNIEEKKQEQPEEIELDDDFVDFDDFQSVNTNNIESIVDGNNPWDNSDNNESNFGGFTANFDDGKLDGAENFNVVESEPVLSTCDQINPKTEDVNHNFEDDDFGDFDDFQSSSVQTKSQEVKAEESMECQEMPVLNLQSTESDYQIIESITKVLSSVFLEEISEPESDFEGKLESLLSETWGHLMQTDERQPYIVNWNNSLGQKTLLKALCIDSRNILFGPKWSSSMPKFAANLSNAPLQPQKQASLPSSTVTQPEVVGEKSLSKPSTWTDPFTSDGQEFTYAEALLLDLEHLMATLDQMAHNHSTLKISELLSHACNTESEPAPITSVAPSDVNSFDAPLPSNSDKIYSNTLGVQPLRQINLPDTHIFTPTDSEIPRSKTIHYDHAPTVLLPQPVMADGKNQIDAINTQNSNNITNNDFDNNEYWDFQNFKISSDTSSLPGIISNSQVTTQVKLNLESATTRNALPVPNIAYQTELLQPVKIEPANTMPTLNWPNPGEVSDGFDDFSDFVSTPSQPAEQESSSMRSTEPLPEISHTNISVSVPSENIEEVMKSTHPNADDFDDDFDTFQSALPSKSAEADVNCGFTGSNQISSQIKESVTPKIDSSFKSDSITYPSMPRPIEALTPNLGFISNPKELTSKMSIPSVPTSTNLLQPTPASFTALSTQTQQKSGQILQPLSLESYSQINWPSPGIDLQDLSRFNPVETLQSLKSDLSVGGLNKVASPIHAVKNATTNQVSADDDIWGEFVSSKPKQQQSQPKKPSAFVDDDEWTDFISSPSVKPQNGLNTISLNVHTNSSIQKSVQNKFAKQSNQASLDIPTLNYITPKSNPHKVYNEKHFQNL